MRIEASSDHGDDYKLATIERFLKDLLLDRMVAGCRQSCANSIPAARGVNEDQKGPPGAGEMERVRILDGRLSGKDLQS